MAINPTGIAYIDALLLGYSWTGNTRQSAEVNYVYTPRDADGVETDRFFDVDEQFESSVTRAVIEFRKVANIGFDKKLPGYPDVGLTFDLTPRNLGDSVLGLASWSDPPSQLTDVLVEVSSTQPLIDDIRAGTLGYVTILHELGHAVGLAHPDDLTGQAGSAFGVSLPVNEQNLDSSMMISILPTPGTFTSANRLPITPMIDDIAALQYLYGANMGSHSGNDTYTFNGIASVAKTLWDAGGIDTVDQSTTASDIRIDISEGYDRASLIGNEAIWFAFGSNIENILSGVGNDALYGNALGNLIWGNSGNDVIDAGAGNDDVNGNRGEDNIWGGVGNDILRGGKDADIIRGEDGDDYINGNIGNDIVLGGNGNDYLRGGKDDDIVFGGDGNDFISGDKGNDRLNGGTGADIFFFFADSGVDIIEDFFAFGLTDRIQFSPDVFVFPELALASTQVIDGNSFINLGGGNSVTVLGVTNLAPDDFIIA